jgi:hypothetical protein
MDLLIQMAAVSFFWATACLFKIAHCQAAVLHTLGELFVRLLQPSSRLKERQYPRAALRMEAQFGPWEI